MSEKLLELPAPQDIDPDAFIQAAMRWHFSPDTGSRFWLNRAKTLGFNPITDVRSFADLTLFPNVANELRDVPVEDLIPQGYGPNPQVQGVFESGGTTGAPKRVVFMKDWFDYTVQSQIDGMTAKGLPAGLNWLVIAPSGPHIVGEVVRQNCERNGGIRFTIDMDPRWVKKLIATGQVEQANAYAEHLIDQAEFILQTQNVGALMTTPPLLERLAKRDDLVDVINKNVKIITWGGAHMDADTRHIYETEVFPDVKLSGIVGSTMILSGAPQRDGLTPDDPHIVDPSSLHISFSVVDPKTLKPVAYGERGQVIMSHVSKGFLLPNNLERDMATRIEGPTGQVGDSLGDVSPVATFDGEAVIEGVY
jgi:phenylacetate-coenzyme A ligase PaaK-like adenylate-forming protein